jgi:hypothetical protein
MRRLVCKDAEDHVHFGHKWVVGVRSTLLGASERIYFCPRCDSQFIAGRTQVYDFNEIAPLIPRILRGWRQGGGRGRPPDHA